MSLRPLLDKLGFVSKSLGTASALAFAMGTSEGATRTGFYADLSVSGAEKLATVVNGAEVAATGTNFLKLFSVGGIAPRINLPQGTATPVDGDFWHESSGWYVNHNGVSILIGGGIGGTLAATQIAFGSGANTVAGSANLTWNGSVIGLNGGLQLTPRATNPGDGNTIWQRTTNPALMHGVDYIGRVVASGTIAASDYVRVFHAATGRFYPLDSSIWVMGIGGITAQYQTSATITNATTSAVGTVAGHLYDKWRVTGFFSNSFSINPSSGYTSGTFSDPLLVWDQNGYSNYYSTTLDFSASSDYYYVTNAGDQLGGGGSPQLAVDNSSGTSGVNVDIYSDSSFSVLLYSYFVSASTIQYISLDQFQTRYIHISGTPGSPDPYISIQSFDTQWSKGVDYGFTNDGRFGFKVDSVDLLMLDYVGGFVRTNFEFRTASSAVVGGNLTVDVRSAGTATSVAGWTSGNQSKDIVLGSGLTLSGGILSAGGSGGTVTSVALSLPSIFSVSGSPVTSSGTLTATLASQTANTVFAAPDGSAGAPTFRALVSADLPSVTLTATQVGFGSGANALTGSANLTYDSTLATGGLTIANTTASTTSATGALKVSGGVGVAGDIFAAGTITAWSGTFPIRLFYDATKGASIMGANNTYSGALAVGPTIIGHGNTAFNVTGTAQFVMGTGLSTTDQGNANIVLMGIGTTMGTASSNTIAIVNGGAISSNSSSSVIIGRPNSTGGNAVIIGRTAAGTTDSVVIGSAASAITGTGGVAIGRSASTGGFSNAVALGNAATATKANQMILGTAANITEVTIPTTTASTSTTTGALVVSGGAGFAKAVFIGGILSVAPTVVASGVQTAALITGAANTGLTASTEVTDVNFNLARTVQWATGALATQRAVRIQAPTYAFVGASTITTASTLSISGAPTAGTNATITTAYALNVEAGNTNLGGTATIGSLTGTATQIVGATAGNVLTTVTLGSGLSLTSGTLTAPGALTATQVGFGSGTNTLTGSANLTYDSTLSTGGLTIANTTAATTSATGALKVSGGVGVAGAIMVAAGTAGTPAIGFGTANTSGFFQQAADTVSASFSATERVRLAAATMFFQPSTAVSVNAAAIGTVIPLTNSALTGTVPLRANAADGGNGFAAAVFGSGTLTANGGTTAGVYGFSRNSGGDGTAVGIYADAQWSTGGGVGVSRATAIVARATSAVTTAGKTSYAIDAAVTATGASNAASVTGVLLAATAAASSDAAKLTAETLTIPSTFTGTTVKGHEITVAWTGTASTTATTVRGLDLSLTVNQGSTLGYTAVLANVTETATGSGTKLLLDLQVGGVSRSRVSNLGQFVAGDAAALGSSVVAYFGNSTANTPRVEIYGNAGGRGAGGVRVIQNESQGRYGDLFQKDSVLYVGTNCNFTPSSAQIAIAGATVTIQPTTASTTATTGALVVSGGLGVSGSVFANGGTISARDGVSDSAKLTADGGGGWVQFYQSGTASYIGQRAGGTGIIRMGIGTPASGTVMFSLSNNTLSTGAANVFYTTDSTSTATGSLIVAGGAGFAKAVFVGGILSVAPTAVATGVQTAALITGAANTGLTLSTEVPDVQLNLARTVQWATGALTTQRAVLIQAPTYAFVGASTITTASTVSITGAPVAGTNATITTAYALNVESGNTRLGGTATIASLTGTATQLAGATASNVLTTITIGSGLSLSAGTLSVTSGGTGTVTSVALALPAEFTVSGSPVTTAGTLTGTWANQTTNKVFASPNGSTGTPTFRALVSADIPTVSSVTLAATQVGYGNGSSLLAGSANLTYDATTGTGGLTIANTTAATTSATGALIVTGGAGIGGALYVGGAFSVATRTGTFANVASFTSAGLLIEQTPAQTKTNLGYMTRYATTITGDNVTTSFAITHSLGTKDVAVAVYDASDNQVAVGVIATSTSAVNVTFLVAPTPVTYRVVVIG